jgi:uncharacterized RDD family membrane protein YckC
LAEASASTQGNLALNIDAEHEWRGELNQRLEAYRARRRKPSLSEAQPQLPFEETRVAAPVAVQVAEPPIEKTRFVDDFAFTIAIGRPPRSKEADDTQLLIDVSLPPRAEEGVTVSDEPLFPERTSLFPVASIDERKRAAIIDATCLAFAYGGFLALFGSLGGHFTISKLSGAICFFTFAFVYIQYFGLFTIFGGTTPGMMVRGLHVASFTGEAPSARQFFLRAAGYMLSAGAFFLGFLWALWDEDALTWHDRLSRTYLAVPDMLLEADLPHSTAAH